MLYWFLNHFKQDFGFLNIIHYISVRSIISLLFSLLISFSLFPWLISKLRFKQLGQVIREDGPGSHFSKKGTPTMGGALIILATIIPALLWNDLSNRFIWYSLSIFICYGLIGFSDDYKKIKKDSSKGLTAKQKLLFQTLIALIISAINYWQNPSTSEVTIPFLKNTYLNLGVFYIFFSAFIIVGTSNAVNLTDGLDGLAIGPIIIASGCFGILSYLSGHYFIAHYLNFPFVEGAGELTVLAACLVGAGLGFLWYNAYPAQIFMGDVGSLALGGALGALAVFAKHELILVIIGGIFVVEALSVITQVLSFKLTGKRVFRMAPIHHHFELKGWPEPKVIVRFWIISIILGLLGLLTIKIR
jgi:phospho-N-acetylmuramoyl-pentapeptide-transferase